MSSTTATTSRLAQNNNNNINNNNNTNNGNHNNPNSIHHGPSRSPRKSAAAGGGITTASSPNFGSRYSAHSSAPQQSRLGSLVPGLPRKASLAALTQNSLASIPDATETYALNSVLSETQTPAQSPTSPRKTPNMAPMTPGRAGATGGGGGEDVSVGDIVDVPGNMVGIIRFVGSVQGRKGTFAGVELNQEFAPRGKNSGDVDGCVLTQILANRALAVFPSRLPPAAV